jgi:hypothetical protein
MDDDLVAVLVETGGVAAQRHRERRLLEPDPLERPEVVVVESCGLDVDRGPALLGDRIGSLTGPQAGQRVVGGHGLGIDGEHPPSLCERIARFPAAGLPFRRVGRRVGPPGGHLVTT